MVIDNIDVKYCAPVLVQPIHHLSLISLPLDWKTHMISPVYEFGVYGYAGHQKVPKTGGLKDAGYICTQMVDNSRH